jgi:uncharacterized membrane protein YsdA (DUF1294 family)
MLVAVMHAVSVVMFGVLYAAMALAWAVPVLLAAWYALASLGCFAIYAWDKAAARAGRRRVAENSLLLLLGLAGGWPGAALAQQVLRHKTAKAGFQARFWATVLLNVGGFVYLSSPASALHQG